jgi:hypothetical protein
MATIAVVESKFELHDEIVACLSTLQVPKEDILKAQEGWIKIQCSMLLNSIEAKFPTGLTEIDTLPKETSLGLPSPNTLKDWMSPKSVNDPHIDRLINAYTSVWETGSTTDTELIPTDQTGRVRGVIYRGLLLLVGNLKIWLENGGGNASHGRHNR